jgi:hypothetical protein
MGVGARRRRGACSHGQASETHSTLHALADRDTLAPPQLERLVYWADENYVAIGGLGLLGPVTRVGF